MVTPMDQGYVLVADRLAAFVKDYPTGRIVTRLVDSKFNADVLTTIPATSRTPESTFQGAGLVIVAAEVFKDPNASVPDGTGLASMVIPGPTQYTRGSEVENAETSAVGRALAMIGYLAKNPDGSARISSAEEIAAKNPEAQATDSQDPPITQKQRGLLFSLAKKAGLDLDTGPGKGAMKREIKKVTGKASSKDLLNSDMDALVAHFTAKAVAEATGGEVVDE